VRDAYLGEGNAPAAATPAEATTMSMDDTDET
jgi:hypothetical protein